MAAWIYVDTANLLSGTLFIADFKPPTNHVLAHVASLIMGHEMKRSDVSIIPPLLIETGFTNTLLGLANTADQYLVGLYTEKVWLCDSTGLEM